MTSPATLARLVIDDSPSLIVILATAGTECRAEIEALIITGVD